MIQVGCIVMPDMKSMVALVMRTLHAPKVLGAYSALQLTVSRLIVTVSMFLL